MQTRVKNNNAEQEAKQGMQTRVKKIAGQEAKEGMQAGRP